MFDKSPFDFMKKIFKSDNKNKYSYLIVFFLLGVLLLIVSSFFKNTNSTIATNGTAQVTKNDNTVAELSEADYESNMESQLKGTLEQISGVGNVKLMIYFDSGSEQIPAININDSTSLTEEKDTTGGTRSTTQNNKGNTVVMTNEGDKQEPFIVKAYKPKITGVCIVAEGAADDDVRLKITEAVESLFDISADKVNVYPMKK